MKFRILCPSESQTHSTKYLEFQLQNLKIKDLADGRVYDFVAIEDVRDDQQDEAVQLKLELENFIRLIKDEQFIMHGFPLYPLVIFRYTACTDKTPELFMEIENLPKMQAVITKMRDLGHKHRNDMHLLFYQQAAKIYKEKMLDYLAELLQYINEFDALCLSQKSQTVHCANRDMRMKIQALQQDLNEKSDFVPAATINARKKEWAKGIQILLGLYGSRLTSLVKLRDAMDKDLENLLLHTLSLSAEQKRETLNKIMKFYSCEPIVDLYSKEFEILERLPFT